MVSEYSAGSNPANAYSLIPVEVKKWIHFGRPYSNHQGGDIWFGTDGYLYYTSGITRHDNSTLFSLCHWFTTGEGPPHGH